MTNADVIIATIRWIEEHLREELPVSSVARKAGYSPHHFIRLFGGVTGIPPKEYILKRKLSEAGRELAAGGSRVTDVAFDYGFKDLETFTRAFRRELGATPSAVRRGAHFPFTAAVHGLGEPGAPPRIGIDEAPILEQVEPFFLAGWSIRVSEQTDAVGKLWARFTARAPSIPRLRSPMRFRQLASWTEESEDVIDIMVAAEVVDFSTLPIDLVGKSVPGCACLVFTHHGSMAKIGESYRSIYQTWLARTDRRPTMPFNFERYFEDAKDPFSDDYIMQICVPVS